MKKLIYIVGLLLITTTCFSQSIVNRANSSYTVQDSRFSAALNLFVPRYADTTAANAGTAEGIDTLGAIIYTYDVQALWVRRYDSGKKWAAIGGGGGGSGTVTSVGWTGGIVSIANPTTTPAFTIAGTSGGIPYFSSGSTWATSAALAANSLIIGGGAGIAPSSITTGTGILTALGVNIGSAGAPVLFDGAGGTPSSMVGTNITGTASGLSIGGNAATATILQTARNIQGVSFNGSAAIDIINGTGFVKATGTTLSYDNSTYVTSNIYTADGTLAGARAVALNGNSLTINQGVNEMLHLDPTVNSEHAHLQANNSTGGGNLSLLVVQTSDINAESYINVGFNAGSEAQIKITADNTGTLAEYSADTHTFTGDIYGLNGAAETRFLIDNTNDAYSIGNITTHGISIDGATTTISYKATTNIFTGNILTATNNTYDIGDATNAFQDIYGRILHLDGSTSGEVTFQSDALGNAPNGTTLSGTGYVPVVMYGALSSDFTMSDVNTVQPVFPTGFDVWTLQASTTYMFEGTYILTHNATSHSVGMSFELAGGASVTSINYYTLMHATALGTPTASQNTNAINVTTNVAVNTAGANAIETIRFWGILRVNAGGSFTPSITFSAAPGGTCLARVGTYIKFTPIGTNTATNLGNVN